MLKAQVLGNVGRDPDITTKDTYKMARFGIATNRKVKGEKITTWVNVTCFGDKRVEFIEQYVKKGTKLFIEGDVSARAFTTKEGDVASSLDVTISAFDGKLEICSSWDDGERPEPKHEAEYRPKPKADTRSRDDYADDAPF